MSANASKPVLERNSPVPVRLPLTRRKIVFDHTRSAVVERQEKSLRRHAENQDGGSNLSSPIIDIVPALFVKIAFEVIIGVGDPPTNCKWLQHLVADEEI